MIICCVYYLQYQYYLYNLDLEKMLDDFFRLYLYSYVYCFRDVCLILQFEKKNVKKKYIQFRK